MIDPGSWVRARIEGSLAAGYFFLSVVPGLSFLDHRGPCDGDLPDPSPAGDGFFTGNG